MAEANEISKQQKLMNPGNLDAWYGPYNSAELAIAAVPVSIRPGKTVGINITGGIEERWWKNGVDLVPKIPEPVIVSDQPYSNSEYTLIATEEPYSNSQYLAL